jgi:hypothetical protein
LEQQFEPIWLVFQVEFTCDFLSRGFALDLQTCRYAHVSLQLPDSRKYGFIARKIRHPHNRPVQRGRGGEPPGVSPALVGLWVWCGTLSST